MRNLFFRSLSQIIAVLTPVVTSLRHICVKKSPNLYFMYHGDRKMGVNSKGKFEVNYSFFWSRSLKILKFWITVVKCQPKHGSKNSKLVFHVPKVDRKIGILCTNVDRKMKIKSKNFTFRWIIRLWNHSLKIWSSNSMWWRHQPKIGSKKGPTTITSQRESKVWGGIPGFCNVQKLTWEMNFFSQILYGYWFWSFYHC